MELNIRNPEADRLAEESARATGETKTDAVIRARQDRLDRMRRERGGHAAGARGEAGFRSVR